MITNELEVGKKYKDLKVMCEVLDFEYFDSTNSRKATLREIESHYKLEKQGRGYIVLEKYDTPIIIKNNNDGRINNGGGIRNTKYDKLMDDLIIDWLHRKNEAEFNISFNEIFTQDKENNNKNIPLFSDEYANLMNIGHEEFSKEIAIRKDLVDMFREKMYMISSKCFETSLGRLQKQNIIILSKETMIKYYGDMTEIADEDLLEEINLAEQETYETMEITSFKRRNPNVNKKFKREVCKILSQHRISSYWKVYNIEILEEDKIISIENVDKIKIELVNRFVNSIRDSLYNKKYDEIDDTPIAIGEKRESEKYNPFMNNTEDMVKLSNILFIDYDKSNIEVMDEEWEKGEAKKEKEKMKQKIEEKKVKRKKRKIITN